MSKRALITGGAGFIGSHLVEHILKNTDWSVVVLDRLDTSGNLNRIAEVLQTHPQFKSRYKFVFHDLKAEINSFVSSELEKPDLIFHLAASSHVDDSIKNPLLYVQDNVVGACNILNFARQLDNLDFFGFFDTDEIYGNALGDTCYEEGDRMLPRNPYSSSKLGSSMLAYSFYTTYGLPLCITNCVNVFGERQDCRKFIPICIKKILNDELIEIHSYTGAKESGSRFYVHARNVSAACLFLVDKFQPGERYNLWGQKEVSNLDMAQFISDIIGKPLNYKLVDFHSNRPGHDLRYCLKPGKLWDLGFDYPVSIEESLKNTVEWTLKNKHWLN